MTRTLLTLILLLSFGTLVLAQNDVKKFNLLNQSVNNELRLEANPVGTEDIFVYIYSDENKMITNPLKIEETFQIQRGKQTVKIDVSGLAKGEYTFDIVQDVYVRQLKSSTKRVVFSQNFIKE